jgi:transcriptional regulator GlxA family with amidase domain
MQTGSAQRALPYSVAILLFDDIEVLDFAGPFEVFGVTDRHNPQQPFNVFTVAQEIRPIRARNNLQVIPHFGFANCPPIDILIVPGGGGYRANGEGYGTRHEKNNQQLLDWIKQVDANTELTLSVCSGALILASAGLLDHKTVTTHRGAYKELRETCPTVNIRENVKMVDQDHIVTSGGISAGIDMSLGVVARLLGRQIAIDTAYYMEYDWRPET